MSIYDILKQPIKTDLLEHYIEYITMVQDWEYIRVFENKDNKEVILNYCYCRLQDGKWDRCPEKKGRACLAKCKINICDTTYELQDEDGKSKTLILHVKKKHIACDEITFGQGHMHKALQEDIFTERYIPELEEYDKSECKNKIVLYEYPIYTIFPDGEQDNHKLGLYYERQQIEILRQLAMKQKALREATKKAVAAIMGRNMSHNLGSHVLSYLSDKEGMGFYKYLQGRSDFLAEISTTNPSWTTSMGLIRDIFDPFVYSDLRTKKGELLDNIGRSIYVTDEEGNNKHLDASKIRLSIEYNRFVVYYKYCSVKGQFIRSQYSSDRPGRPIKDPSLIDLEIDVPHGIIGSHAMYSILENYIRNAVKHNSKEIKDNILNTGNNLDIKVKIVSDRHEELFKVILSDNISKDTDGEKIGNIRRFIDGGNSILVDYDGTLKHGGGWGIKEMRLSSAWLRAITTGNIQFKVENPPLFSVSEQNSLICFVFYLLKPFNILLVDDTSPITEKPDKGIYKAESLLAVESMISSGSVRHKFIVINVRTSKEWLKKNLIQLPTRVFLVENTSDCGMTASITKNDYNELLQLDDEFKVAVLYEKWARYLKDPLPSIMIPEDDDIQYDKLDHYDTETNVSNSIIFEHGTHEMSSKDTFYWEWYSISAGASTLGSKLKVIRDTEEEGIKRKTLYELYEAVLTKVIIADERLFTKIDNKLEYEGLPIKRRELWGKWRVEIINLNKKDDKIVVDTKNELNICWTKFIEREDNITFFLIHQTTLDNIGEELFNSKIPRCNKIENVIIHSGRGHVDITPGFKFLEFSNLEKLIIDKPDKHQLTNLLMSVKGGVNNGM